MPVSSYNRTSPSGGANNGAGGNIVPLEELEGIRRRIVAYDETREAVIKVGGWGCVCGWRAWSLVGGWTVAGATIHFA